MRRSETPTSSDSSDSLYSWIARCGCLAGLRVPTCSSCPLIAWSPDEAHPCDFHSEDASMAGLLRKVDRVAGNDCTLLLLGETGVGKDRLARAIHRGSLRSKYPFVHVNCGALPAPLVEGELFGHRKGAFTGADQDYRGAFQRAEGGTLFLNEIGTMQLDIQHKILGAVENHEVHPLGASRAERVDVRIISATNQDLRSAVKQGGFREDLYYRLSVLTLTIPPLRERKSDLVRLLKGMLAHFAEKHRSDVQGLSEKAMDALLAHGWRGNVRELVHVVERAVILAQGPRLEPSDLGLTTLEDGEVKSNGSCANGNGSAAPSRGGGIETRAPILTVSFRDGKLPKLKAAEKAFFKQMIQDYLHAAKGRVRTAARLAGITRQAVERRMSTLKLRRKDEDRSGESPDGT